MASSIEDTKTAERLLQQVIKDSLIQKNPYHPERISFCAKDAHFRKRRVVHLIKDGLNGRS